MHILTAVVDGDGQSYLAERAEIALATAPGRETIALARIFGTAAGVLPASPPRRGRSTPKALAAGQMACYVIEHSPRAAGEERGETLHHADAIDLVCIVEGGGDMLLGDGAHPIGVGDWVVMPGVDHAFRPGADGCRMIAFSIGTPPAAG